MKKARVDVVICTKDRSHLLKRAVKQAKTMIPCNNVIIVDSSPDLNAELLSSLGVKVIHTPNVLLGVARQAGLEAAETSVVVFLDDDVTLENGWYPQMLYALLKDPKALAVSSKVVFGYKSDKIIEKLHACSVRSEGGSVGVAVFKREKILNLGGFNPKVHRGEDAELDLRIRHHGFKWVREQKAVAYHPLTFKQYMRKAVENVEGWILVWNHSKHRMRFLIERVGSFLFMPFYYGFLTLDPRVAYYYLLYKAKLLFAFLWRVNHIGI